jgi:hypothetical protein
MTSFAKAAALAIEGGSTRHWYWPLASENNETAKIEAPVNSGPVAPNSLAQDCLHELSPRPAFVAFVPSTEDVFTSAIASLSTMAEARSISEASASAAAVRAALFLAYRLEDKSQSRAAAKELMRFVECNARVNELAATNRLLVEFDAARLSSRAITGVVRATARMHARLPAWDKAYARAWSAIEAQGNSPEAMFVGMEKPVESGVAEKAK